LLRNPLDEIKSVFCEEAVRIFSKEFDESLLKLEQPPNPEMGDLGIACFPLSKLLRKSPKDIAGEFAEGCASLPYVKRVRAEGPFVNLEIDPGTFFDSVCKLVKEKNDEFGHPENRKNIRVMVEYSAPNTNKPQHLGHIRNNVLGVALSNVLDAAGYDVVKVNLVNDRGIHICKSMLAYKKWGQNETPESTGIKGDHFVGKYYVMYEQKAKEKPYLAEEASEMLKDWENGDADVVQLWKMMNGWVLDGFYTTYERLGCEFDKYYFESDTYKLGKDIVLKGLEEGLLSKNDAGDIIIQLQDFDTDTKVLLRKDGTSVYITQDIGTTILKFKDFQLDRSIFIVASEQNLHFKLLFYILKKLGYEWADRCYHLNYGMVYLPEGKMKSREGKVIDADDLMDEMHALAKDEVLKRAREMGGNELEDVSEAIGLSAIRYFILKVHPQKDIHFSPEESLSFEGATGPYAQYSYARLSSILRKGKDILSGIPDFTLLGNPEEVKLILSIAFYPQVVQEAAESYNPSRIASYIFDLAKSINKFHHDHSVLNTGDAALTLARGSLIEAARRTLGNALKLLGITPLERM